MPLEDFRNIDPDVFEWVNPDEIQPGNVTCGFLKAPLGEAEGVVYPMVKVCECILLFKFVFTTSHLHVSSVHSLLYFTMYHIRHLCEVC